MVRLRLQFIADLPFLHKKLKNVGVEAVFWKFREGIDLDFVGSPLFFLLTAWFVNLYIHLVNQTDKSFNCNFP